MPHVANDSCNNWLYWRRVRAGIAVVKVGDILLLSRYKGGAHRESLFYEKLIRAFTPPENYISHFYNVPECRTLVAILSTKTKEL